MKKKETATKKAAPKKDAPMKLNIVKVEKQAALICHRW